jgi:hypothetical protein
MEAQVVAAAADRLRLRWRTTGEGSALGQLALGGQDGKTPTVVLLQSATEDRRDDEDKPPVVADEICDPVHVTYIPA